MNSNLNRSPRSPRSPRFAQLAGNSRHQRWLGSLILFCLLMLGAVVAANAQSQICRDISNITVCADELVVQNAATNHFTLVGNVKIGPKGGAMVVRVSGHPPTQAGFPVSQIGQRGGFIHIDNAPSGVGANDVINGRVHFINDATSAEPLFSSHVAFRPNLPQTRENLVSGFLFVDPVTRRIFLPAGGAAPYGVGNTYQDVDRNAPYKMDFVNRAGLAPFYKDGGTIGEFALIDAEFDLTAKTFKATMPIDLKLGDAVDNPNLRITARLQWSETGQFNGGIDGFKFRLGGLLMDMAGVVLKLAQGATPAEFQAATVKVLKTDNPGVPNLDPTDASLVFALTNLKYKNSRWELGGVEVPIKPWEFGSAFKMTNQTLGIINEANTQSFQIKSTMEFGAGSDASKLPITMKIGRALAANGTVKPIFSAGLQNIKPKLGTFTFNLTNVAFVGDPAQDFFGLQATTAALQWPPQLGGQTAAALNGFKLGINGTRKLQFQLGSGTIGLPPYENQVFKGTLQATVGVVAETMVITGTGNFTIKLAGNNNSAGVAVNAIMRYNKDVSTAPAAALTASMIQASALNAGKICVGPLGVVVPCPNDPPPATPPTPKAFELKLAGFNFKVAGFGLNVTNPRSTDDGGFAADDVGFSLPFGLQTDGSSANAQIQGLAVKGDGTISISGGGLGLPSLKIGNLRIVGLKGSFLKETNGNYAFVGGAKLPLPGIENIGVEVTIRSDGNGSFAGAGVKVEINLPTTAGIPVGPSGMLLTGMRGTFDINNSTTTIGLGVTFRSAATLPLGPLGQLSLVKVDGDITVQFNPFKFIGNTDLAVLIFEVASATVRFGDGEGFDGRNGINVEVVVNKVLMKGTFKLRYSKGTASDPNKRRFAANANWQFGIKQGQFGTALPPFNLGGIDAQLAGGLFTDQNNSPATETSGIRASVCGPNGNLCLGMFVNLGEYVGSGDFIDFTNIEKYALIPAAAIRAAAARGEGGFASRRLTLDEVNQLGLVVAADALAAGVFEEVVDIPIAQTTTLLAGIDYFSGTPLVRLQLPDGTILTESTVNGTNQTVLAETQAITKSIYFVVSGATPGTYKLLIDNAADYEKVSYTLNTAPQLTIGDVTCPSSNPPTPVNTVCLIGLNASAAGAVAASTVEQINASSATITWSGSDLDSPGATVNIGYIKDSGDKDNIDYSAINFVAEGFPLSAGSHTINFKESGTGAYRLVVIADDGINGLVYLASSTVISVTDKLAPAVPSGLQAVPQAGEMLVKWTQNSEADLAGYEIGFGLVNDPNQFIYSRNMGPKVVVTGTNNIVDAKIWGLQDNVTIFYGLRAYDGSGNFSDWTPLQSATPWALSPKSWTPVPNGKSTGSVEIAFAEPIKIATLENALTVMDANGNVVPGTSYLLVNLDSTAALGVGFQPSSTAKGQFTATLKGGAAGIQAEDGRLMDTDYKWSFTLQPEQIFLPLINR